MRLNLPEATFFGVLWRRMSFVPILYFARTAVCYAVTNQNVLICAMLTLLLLLILLQCKIFRSDSRLLLLSSLLLTALQQIL